MTVSRLHTSCLMVAALLLSRGAIAESDLTLIQAPRVARPVTIVPPKFPAGTPIPVAGVKVDIVGTVRVDGTFEAASITAPAGFEPFAQAVSEVLVYWRFEPAIDEDRCVPKEDSVQIPVWFEGSADDPQIAVALPTIAKSDQSDPRIAAVRTPRVQYPPRMLGVEGKVRVLTLVSPSGDVISANVLSGTALGAFDSVAQRSAGGISIKWTEPAPDKPICMLKTYLFCMESAARTRLPFAECRKW